MLRDLIAWVLNNYLGRYVENLNTTQLTVALLSGELTIDETEFNTMSHPLSMIRAFTVIFRVAAVYNIAIRLELITKSIKLASNERLKSILVSLFTIFIYLL